MPSVLIIDDDHSILDNLQFNLELYGYTILKSSDAYMGIELFKQNAATIDAVITDMRMPGISGLEVMRQILIIQPDMGIIVLTGHGDMENAITAMREGAFNYIQKPCHMENLLFVLDKAKQKKDILIENKKLQADLIAKNLYLQGLHDAAQRILMNFIPKKLPDFILFDTAHIYRSCEKVGGDMIDLFETGDFMFFCIFDVCTHGILAAVNTILIKAFFCRMKQYQSNSDISKVLQHDFSELNREMCTNMPADFFATLFAGFIDQKTNRLYYVSAGHIDQLLIHEGNLISLPSTGTVLGSFEEAVYEVKEHALSAGDALLLYTDGLIDAWKNELYTGQDAVNRLILERKKESIQKIVHDLDQKAMQLTGGELDDDLTILAIQLKNCSIKEN